MTELPREMLQELSDFKLMAVRFANSPRQSACDWWGEIQVEFREVLAKQVVKEALSDMVVQIALDTERVRFRRADGGALDDSELAGRMAQEDQPPESVHEYFRLIRDSWVQEAVRRGLMEDPGKRARRERMRSGYLYVASNPYMPGIVKIGLAGHVQERLDSLSQSSAVPAPFDLVHHVAVSDVYGSERRVHDHLVRYRVSENREFFRARCVEKAIRLLNQEADP